MRLRLTSHPAKHSDSRGRTVHGFASSPKLSVNDTEIPRQSVTTWQSIVCYENVNKSYCSQELSYMKELFIHPYSRKMQTKGRLATSVTDNGFRHVVMQSRAVLISSASQSNYFAL